jgi:hypothetical protein
MTKLRARLRVPSPAMLVAMVALVVSLGGVTYAAAPKIQGLITGAKVANNSLTGADIQESTLAKVPNANTVDGKDSTAFGGVTHAYEYGSTAPVPIGGVYASLAASPPLPAGAYSVVARMEAVNKDGDVDAVYCEIKTHPDGLVRDRASHNHLPHYHLTLVGAFTISEGSTIGVECNGSEGAEATAKLLVTRVDQAN